MEHRIDDRIAYARYLIEQRLAERLRIDDLATLVGLSPSRFAHLFRQSLGTSPLHYLRELRIERARLLLKDTTLPVGEVMRQIGCTDASHFSRDFHARCGVAPRAYRAMCRADDRHQRAG